MNFLLLIFTGIGLSMDAFSLSLAYGTIGINSKSKFFLSLITGLFHFFMPLFGFLFGKIIFSFFNCNSNIVIFLIFFFIGIQMILSSFNETEDIKFINYVDYFFFALAVSIDSFSVGISFTNFNDMALFSPFVFCACSFIFTYAGLHIGNKIANLLGKISTFVGGLLIITIGLKFLISG